MELSSQKCVPCDVGGIPLAPDEVQKLLKDIPNWHVTEDAKKLSRLFQFKDFKEALSFVNKAGDLAEKDGHHPDMKIVYNKVYVDLTTHEVKGLSLNDFILASKIDLI